MNYSLRKSRYLPILACILLLISSVLLFEAVAGNSAAPCGLSLHRAKAKKNLLKITKKTGEKVVGDYLVSHTDAKNNFTVLADSILRTRFCLQPDSNIYLSACRQFTSPKDLSNCKGVELKLFFKNTANACLRFTLCDAAGDWNCTLPKYILGHTGDNTVTQTIMFSEFQKNSDYGSQPAIGDSTRLDQSQVLGYKITVFIPADEGQQCGDFFIKSIRTF
jgi:hypothetical protein